MQAATPSDVDLQKSPCHTLETPSCVTTRCAWYRVSLCDFTMATRRPCDCAARELPVKTGSLGF